MPKLPTAQIDAGSMRHRVQLQKYGYTQSANGDLVETWNTVATLWANLQPLQLVSPRGVSEVEPFAEQELQPRQTVLITVRYGASLNVVPEMRVVWNGHTYVIRSAVNVGNRNHQIDIVAEEMLETATIDA